MERTLIIVVVILFSTIILFVWPTMTMADRTDDISQLTAQAATTNFVTKAATTGKITQADYDEYLQTLTSTGNTYDVNLTAQVKDINLGKKTSQAQADKVGENAYIVQYTSQIEDAIESNRCLLFNRRNYYISKCKKYKLNNSGANEKLCIYNHRK